MYKEKEPFDDEPLIGQAVSRWQEITFGGNRTGKYQFSPPFNYFYSNYEVIGWMELPDSNLDEELYTNE